MTNRYLAGVFLALVLSATSSFACSCIEIGDGDEIASVNATDAVFRARVITAAMVLTNDDGAVLRHGERETPTGYVQRLVALRVEEIFKGDVAPLTILVTGSGGGDCGYAFEEGREYLIFATLSSDKRFTRLSRSTPVLTTSICTFTKPVESAAALLKSLRTKFPSKEPVLVSWPK